MAFEPKCARTEACEQQHEKGTDMNGPMRTLCAACVATSLTLAAGCGARGGGATPEEAFSNAKAAAERNDWKAVCNSMTEESQEMMAGGIAFGGMMMQVFAGLGGEEDAAKTAKIKQTMAKHGLTDAFLAKINDDKSAKSPEERMKTMVEPINDHGQFIADMMAALAEVGDKDEQGPFTKDATLTNVKIDGDAASGTIETSHGGNKQSEPIAFKKVGGRWLLDLTKSAKSPSGGQPSGADAAAFAR